MVLSNLLAKHRAWFDNKAEAKAAFALCCWSLFSRLAVQSRVVRQRGHTLVEVVSTTKIKETM